MHERQKPTDFDALDKTTEAAGIAISLVMQVPANLAEGVGRAGRDRLHHWRIAYGSAKEVDTHLQLLVAAHAVNSSQAESAINLFDDVRAMTWRLVHPTQ